MRAENYSFSTVLLAHFQISVYT